MESSGNEALLCFTFSMNAILFLWLISIRQFQTLRERFHEPIFIEELPQYHPQHRVPRNGKNHTRYARQITGNQDHQKYLHRMGMHAIPVNQGLQHDIIDQLRDNKHDTHVNQQGEYHRVEIHIHVRGNTHRKPECGTDKRSYIRNNICHPGYQPD